MSPPDRLDRHAAVSRGVRLSDPQTQAYLILLGCLPLFFWELGHPPLFDADEPVYAATGRSLLRSGSFAGWWSPHYNGALWFDKPPMTYWLIGLSMHLFGTNAFAARLPSALAAVLMVWIVIQLGWDLFPKYRSAGLWAGIVAATSVQTIALARAAVTDMILAAALLGAVWMVWRWLENSSRRGALILAGLATGIAALTKGPVAVVLVGGLVLLFLLLTKQFRRLLDPMLWVSLGISLLVALPWYLSMVHLYGNYFVQYFLQTNNLVRYLSPEHPKTQSAFWFLPILVVGFVPWTVGAAVALWQGCRDAWKGHYGALFAVTWILWVFVFFSASQTKLWTYVYPLAPMGAILTGRWIAEERSRRSTTVFAVTWVVLSLAASGLLIYVGRLYIPPAMGTVMVLSGILILSAVFCIYAQWFGKADQAERTRWIVFASPATAMVTFCVVLASAGFWNVSLPDMSMWEIGKEIGRRTGPSQVVVALALKKPSLVFYSDRQILFVENIDHGEKLLEQSPGRLGVCKTKDLNQLIREHGNHFKILRQSRFKYVLICYED